MPTTHALVHHRHVAEPAVAHQSQRVDRGVARRQAVRILRHHVPQVRLPDVLPLGQHPHRVAAGEDADQLTLGIGDQDGADPALMHVFACFLHCRTGRQRQWFLIADDLRHFAVHAFVLQPVGQAG